MKFEATVEVLKPYSGHFVRSCMFHFCPQLDNEWLRQKAPLMIAGMQVPAFGDEQECRFTAWETSDGLGSALVRAMRDAGTFEAHLKELDGPLLPPPNWHDVEVSRRFRCEFVAVDPITRHHWDGENRPAEIPFRLRLKAL